MLDARSEEFIELLRSAATAQEILTTVITTKSSVQEFKNATDANVTATTLLKWETTAEKLTAHSRANEPHNILTKNYISNGNGTYSYTNTTEYSSLHWSIEARIQQDISLVNATAAAAYANIQWASFGTIDGELNVTFLDGATSTPSIVDGDFIITY